MKLTLGPDDLTPNDYIEIYQELRGYDPDRDAYALSVREFMERIGSAYSTGQWSKFHRGLILYVPRDMRNELRAAVGLPEAPMSLRDLAAMMDEGKNPFGANGETVLEVVARGETRKRNRPRFTLSFRKETGEQINAARQAAGLSWDDVGEMLKGLL